MRNLNGIGDKEKQEPVNNKEEDIPHAFPNEGYYDDCSNLNGMTLRDYMAAKALQGELAAQDWVNISWPEENELAERAYLIADAMLKARKEPHDR